MFTGSISYSLYVWHWILLSLFMIITCNGGLLKNIEIGIASHKITLSSLLVIRISKIFLAFLSFLLAYISTRYIETPLRKSDSFKLAICLAAFLSLIGIIGYMIYNQNGLPVRQRLIKTKFALRLEEISKFKIIPKKIDNNCINVLKKIKLHREFYNLDMKDMFCRANTDKIKNIRYILIGDSHAHAAYTGLSKQIDGLFFIGIIGWPANYDGNAINKFSIKIRRKEAHFVYKVLDRLKNRKCLIITRQACYYTGHDFGKLANIKSSKFFSQFKNPKLSYQNAFKLALEDTFERLTRLCSYIYYFTENPEYDIDPALCVFKQDWKPCSQPKYIFEKKAISGKKSYFRNNSPLPKGEINKYR